MHLLSTLKINLDDKIVYLIIGAIISLASTLFLFFLNTRKEKKQKIKEIKNNIVYACSKLITYAISVEQNQAAFRYYKFYYDKFTYKVPQEEYQYKKFQELALKAHFEYQLQKSEVIRYLHELFIYEKVTAKRISLLYNKAVGQDLRDFDEPTIGEYSKYIQVMNGIKDHILYNGIGVQLREIMKMLDFNITKPENNSK